MTENGFLFVTENSGFNRVSHQLIHGLALLLVVITAACSGADDDIRVPEHILEMENLTVYSADTAPAKRISFMKDAVYGDSGEVVIGRMGEVAVDSLKRVYIADVGQTVIYAFESDGRLAGQFGGSGRGPGEFSWWIRNVQIHDHTLYALDANQHRVHIFSLDSLKIKKTVRLAENRGNYKELARAFPLIDNLFVRGDGAYIAEFIMNATTERIQRFGNREMRVNHYLLDKNGRITKKLLSYIREIRSSNGISTQHREPFFGKVFHGFSNDDSIHLAEPDDFLVKKYSPDGDYQGAFFYPLNKIPLTKEKAVEANVSDRNLELMDLLLDLPENWPVLTDMKIDGQDRIWIATTVEDMSIYEWWVLEESGELITKFEWLRDEPIEVIKNGYVYTRQTDEDTGLQQVVRYRIEIGDTDD